MHYFNIPPPPPRAVVPSQEGDTKSVPEKQPQQQPHHGYQGLLPPQGLYHQPIYPPYGYMPPPPPPPPPHFQQYPPPPYQSLMPPLPPPPPAATQNQPKPTTVSAACAFWSHSTVKMSFIVLPVCRMYFHILQSSLYGAIALASFHRVLSATFVR
ncbi:hypothetical protein Dimus_035299 [Dionaea muscipula]